MLTLAEDTIELPIDKPADAPTIAGQLDTKFEIQHSANNIKQNASRKIYTMRIKWIVVLHTQLRGLRKDIIASVCSIKTTNQ